MTKLVAYYRVSDKRKQGIGGLGIDAQRAAVARFSVATGSKLIASYEEAESARHDNLKNRPQLRAAIAHAKRSGATLVIAKLDRLARSVLVTAELMQSGVEFVCCDNPHANRMTIQILAVMAEHESRQISERTRAAMAAAKANGATFGNPHLRPSDQLAAAKAGAAANHRKALEAYEDLAPTMRELRTKGLSFQSIANELNRRGHTTRRQRPWGAMQVLTVMRRLAPVAAA
jgi:DNA invertase Pin-like site-specific DNA recombinase